MKKLYIFQQLRRNSLNRLLVSLAGIVVIIGFFAILEYTSLTHELDQFFGKRAERAWVYSVIEWVAITVFILTALAAIEVGVGFFILFLLHGSRLLIPSYRSLSKSNGWPFQSDTHNMVVDFDNEYHALAPESRTDRIIETPSWVLYQTRWSTHLFRKKDICRIDPPRSYFNFVWWFYLHLPIPGGLIILVLWAYYRFAHIQVLTVSTCQGPTVQIRGPKEDLFRLKALLQTKISYSETP